MITVLIDFFDKKTERHVFQNKMEFPDEMVISAAENDEFTDDEFASAKAENQLINYLNARPFSVSEEMQDFAIEKFPELKDKFDQYDSFFIGRHGLGPEYD